MSLSQWSLLGFAVWTLGVVLLGIGGARLHAVVFRRESVRTFRADVPHGSERYRRIMRAHLNCVENLPIFASLVLLGAVLRVESDLFQTLALCVLPARVLQTTAHVASERGRVVLARFAFFSVQLVCMFGMALILAWEAA